MVEIVYEVVLVYNLLFLLPFIIAKISERNSFGLYFNSFGGCKIQKLFF
jgi:hypothetical protein